MKTTGLNFVEALEMARAGHVIKRVGETFLSFKTRDGILALADGVNIFSPIVDDMLADDWEAVSPQPKTMTFMEAVAAMKGGKKVRRNAWLSVFYIFAGTRDILVYNGTGEQKITFGIGDFEAADWVVAEEEQ